MKTEKIINHGSFQDTINYEALIKVQAQETSRFERTACDEKKQTQNLNKM